MYLKFGNKYQVCQILKKDIYPLQECATENLRILIAETEVDPLKEAQIKPFQSKIHCRIFILAPLTL